MIPHPAKADRGGEDAYFICDRGSCMGVADGVGGWAEVSGWVRGCVGACVGACVARRGASSLLGGGRNTAPACWHDCHTPTHKAHAFKPQLASQCPRFQPVSEPAPALGPLPCWACACRWELTPGCTPGS